MNTPLTKHYSSASVAASRSRWFDRLNCSADQHALDCATLHVGLDAMARVARKRAPQAGYVARYPALPAGDRYQRQSLVETAARHRERLLVTPECDAKAWHRSWAVARHYIEALAR